MSILLNTKAGALAGIAQIETAVEPKKSCLELRHGASTRSRCHASTRSLEAIGLHNHFEGVSKRGDAELTGRA
jgi:hypothetical protein